MKNSFIIYGLIFSSVFMFVTVIIDVKAMTTKNLDDTIVLSNVDNQRISNFILFSKNYTSLTIIKGTHDLVIDNAVFIGQKNTGHLYASSTSNIPFFECTYKNIPCYFIIDFKSPSQIKSMIKDLTPPPSATPFCDKDHNCADTPEDLKNMIRSSIT